MTINFTQIGLFVFVLAVLGYIAKFYFDKACMGLTFNIPQRKGEFENILYYSTSGLIIVLFLSWLIIISYKDPLIGDFFKPIYNILLILENNQSISEEETKLLLKLFASFIIVIFYGFLLISGLLGISLSYGLFVRYFSNIGFNIKLKNNTQIDGRFIYDLNEFIYYVDIEGNWKGIKKEQIESLEEKKQPTLFFSKMKTISIKDLKIIIKSLGYSCILTFFYISIILEVNKLLIIVLIFGVVLIIFERYFFMRIINKLGL